MTEERATEHRQVCGECESEFITRIFEVSSLRSCKEITHK